MIYTCQTIFNIRIYQEMIADKYGNQTINSPYNKDHFKTILGTEVKKVFTLKKFSVKIRQQKSVAEKYQSFLQEMPQWDLSNIYKNQRNIIKQSQKILQLWQSTKLYKQLLVKMLCIFYKKVQIYQLTRSFLFELYACCQYIKNRIGFQLNYCLRIHRIQVEECQTDLLYSHFVSEQQSALTRNTPYIVKDINGNKITLKLAISSTQGFNNVYWQEIFQIVKTTIQKQYLLEQPSKQKQAYFLKLHLEVAPNLSCLGCTQFFFQNHNILNYQNQTQLILMGKINQLNEDAFKAKIQGLGNKEVIILFDCFKQYLDICPKGQSLTQTQKQTKKIEIERFLKNSGCDSDKIQVSFVPIKQDPYRCYGRQKIGQAGFGYIERKFIPGQYVARIKINGNEETRFSFNHQCQSPLPGEQIILKQKLSKAKTMIEEYKYVSALVVKHCHHQAILNNLKRYNINGSIQIRFQQYKMKGISNVALLHHNIKHEDLLSIISYNRQFQFQGKYLMVIPINDYLRLSERSQNNIMSKTDFDSLAVWLKKEFPNQRMKMWEYKTNFDDSEFYIQTESKASALFLYIVMSNCKQKSQFKVSRDLQKMSIREKQQKLKLHYFSQ